MTQMLITGAAGRIGTAITPLLRDEGHELRLLDLDSPDAATSADEVVLDSVTDQSVMDAAASGIDLVVHLAGHPSERPWPELVELNIESTRVVLEAARHAAVPVTMLASSIHAAGFTPWNAATAGIVPARPDSFYGVSKVVGEALGSVYADRFDMAVVLANTRCPVCLEAGRALGYEPRDNAEDHLDHLARRLGYPDPSQLPEMGSRPLGTEFADPDHPLGVTW